MANAAYLDEYKTYWNSCQPLFIPENQGERKDIPLSAQYSVHVQRYNGSVNGYNLHGSECRLLHGGKAIAQWRSINNDGEFFQQIQHSNGRTYLIFRQDLYGYSVLELDSGEIMQFFPDKALTGETFIWTDAAYNPSTNTLAVSGCYWACPFSTHLFTFDNPMSQQQKFVDLIECFDGGYDVYDDVDFKKWESTNLCIARFHVETETTEAVTIPQSEYLAWLREKGCAL